MNKFQSRCDYHTLLPKSCSKVAKRLHNKIVTDYCVGPCGHNEPARNKQTLYTRDLFMESLHVDFLQRVQGEYIESGESMETLRRLFEDSTL